VDDDDDAGDDAGDPRAARAGAALPATGAPPTDEELPGILLLPREDAMAVSLVARLLPSAGAASGARARDSRARISAPTVPASAADLGRGSAVAHRIIGSVVTGLSRAGGGAAGGARVAALSAAASAARASLAAGVASLASLASYSATAELDDAAALGGEFAGGSGWGGVGGGAVGGAAAGGAAAPFLSQRQRRARAAAAVREARAAEHRATLEASARREAAKREA
jgi:hypothetical protein